MTSDHLAITLDVAALGASAEKVWTFSKQPWAREVGSPPTPCPAWPDTARAGQYPGVAAQPLKDALAVHLAKRITKQLQACAIGVTEVE